MNRNCKCGGYGFFWAFEIKGWTGKIYDRVICRDCGQPFWFEKIYYWYYGYINNSQIRTDEETKEFFSKR